MPECVSFLLAVLVYRCLHGSAPGYLASDLQRVSHLNARRRLRSLTTSALVAPRTVCSTIGDHTFPATATSVWNRLPESVRSSRSLQVFLLVQLRATGSKKCILKKVREELGIHCVPKLATPLLQTHLIYFVLYGFWRNIVHCTSLALLTVTPIMTYAPYCVCSL